MRIDTIHSLTLDGPARETPPAAAVAGWTVEQTLAGISRMATPDLLADLEASQQTGMPEYGWSTEHRAVHAALEAELAARGAA